MITTNHNQIRTARYTNTSGIGIAIIASIQYHRGKILDWAAYIGATTNVETKQVAINAARKWGNKLSLSDAQYYFPDLPAERYRE